MLNPTTPFDTPKPVLKVIGMGGGGCNAINRMIELGMQGVEFIGANTDHQALKKCLAPVKIQLGPATTRGLGAGGNPAVGRAAAEESAKAIAEVVDGADMVFLTAGMGGGTGTGSIPVAARISRSLGAVTIAVVTMPFNFEAGRRQKNASDGISNLRPHTNTLISIPNERLLYVAPRNLPIETTFRLADDVLRQAVQGVTELITEPGLINVDFAHIKNLMQMGGGALMSIGQGNGDNKALKAVEQALSHPLLETTSLERAKGILVNFTCGQDLTLLDVESALNYLHSQSGYQADVVMGITYDQRLEDRVQAILVVTGLGAPTLEETLSSVKSGSKAPAQTPAATPAAQPAAQPVVRHAAIPAQPANTEKAYAQAMTPQPANDVPAQPPSTSSAQNRLDLPAFLRRGR